MRLITVLLFSLLFVACKTGKESDTVESKKPNILFIFADDQCFETINALGNTEIETPALDRLVNSGTTFTHAYNMGAWGGAVCVASRAMLLSGQRVWDAKSYPWKTEEGIKNTWPQRLKGEGYKTYFTGKWHVSANLEDCFDVVGTRRGGMPNQTKLRYDRTFEGEETWQPWDKNNEGFWKGGKHWSEIIADETLDFISDAKQQDNPFFMYVAFNAAHDPRQSPKEYVDKYPMENISLPKSFQPEYPYRGDIDLASNIGTPKESILRDEKLAPHPRTPYAVKKNIQEYYAIITHMDHQIQRIFDALDASGQAENTYIVFTADHGLAVGKHGLLGKQNMYDHSMRVPFIISGPTMPKGKIIDSDIYLQDVVPTTLDLAKAKNKEGIYFKSVLPIIDEERNTSYDYITGIYRASQRMVRKDGWKLIHYPKIDTYRMYHVANDPDELVDLANNKEHENIKKALAQLIKEMPSF
ncbi:sulfatase-like hydrolase/transferase [Seonamhaeicola sp.]|uniref:sulfatase-like hydrolase/transferase n=1 Tax=Seonamhaeicola sp. TaxID=1912245 RepID=UPI002622760F|nr:sulfatase-like hydrolase/transferase [Seonamhaeicola sp.]